MTYYGNIMSFFEYRENFLAHDFGKYSYFICIISS